VTNVYKTWFFGSAICHLLPLVQAVSVFVSTLSLSAIAIDRYNLVVRPYAHPLRLPGAIVVAVVLWIVSVVASMPYAAYMVLEVSRRRMWVGGVTVFEIVKFLKTHPNQMFVCQPTTPNL